MSLTAGADYTATTVTLTFGAGTMTDQTVNVSIIEDGEVEPDEVVNIMISGLSVGTAHAVIAAGTGSITIINVDSKFA